MRIIEYAAEVEATDDQMVENSYEAHPQGKLWEISMTEMVVHIS